MTSVIMYTVQYGNSEALSFTISLIVAFRKFGLHETVAQIFYFFMRYLSDSLILVVPMFTKFLNAPHKVLQITSVIYALSKGTGKHCLLQ